jgi:O-antigen ligase
MKEKISIRTFFSQLLAEHNRLEMFQLLLMLVFTCTLALDTRFNSLMLVITFVSLLFTFTPSRFLIYKVPVTLFSGIFIVAILSLAWSTNRPEGWRVIERQLALFFVPVMFFMGIKQMNSAFKIITAAFYLSILIISAYLLKCSADNFFQSHSTLKEWTVRENLYHAFARPVNMHATYLSLFVAMAVFIGFNWMLKELKWWVKAIIFISALVLVITLTFLSSRMVISSLLFIMLFVYPFYIGKV